MMPKHNVGQYAQYVIDATGVVLFVAVALLVMGFMLGAMSPYGSGGVE